MPGGIYLIRGAELVEMTEQPYDSEKALQRLLAEYPNLLAGNQIDSVEPRRWVLVTREAPVPVEQDGPDWFSADHLFLDQDGVPTLVEVKRAADTRARREVVAQMLDYAANSVVHWSIETVRGLFEAECEKRGQDPGNVLEGFLDPLEAQSFPNGARGSSGQATTPDEFWSRVKTNLRAGNVRLVFVSDRVSPELQRIVEFLNQQMDPAEVLAVEIRQFGCGEMRTLVPRVIGLPAKPTPPSGGRQWDEPSFFADLERRQGRKAAEAVRRILTWAKERNLRVVWGRGRQDGSFMPILGHKGVEHRFFAVWTNGSVEIQFQHMLARPPFDSLDMRAEFRSRLNKIQGAPIPMDAGTLERRPGIRLMSLADEAAVDALLDAVEWAVGVVRTVS